MASVAMLAAVATAFGAGAEAAPGCDTAGAQVLASNAHGVVYAVGAPGATRVYGCLFRIGQPRPLADEGGTVSEQVQRVWLGERLAAVVISESFGTVEGEELDLIDLVTGQAMAGDGAVDDVPEVALRGRRAAWLSVTGRLVSVRLVDPNARYLLARPRGPVTGLAFHGRGVSFIQGGHTRRVQPRLVRPVRPHVRPSVGGVREPRTLNFIARNPTSGGAVYDIETPDHNRCSTGLLKLVRHVRAGQHISVPLAPEPRWCGHADHGTVFFEYGEIGADRCAPMQHDCSGDVIVARFTIGIRR